MRERSIRQAMLTHTMGSMTMGTSGAKLLTAVESALPKPSGDIEMKTFNSNSTQEEHKHSEHKPHENVRIVYYGEAVVSSVMRRLPSVSVARSYFSGASS